MRIAIDLLWLRPNKVGGTEPYTRNLLKGFLKLKEDFEFVLICSKDNAETFDEYLNDMRFTRIIAPIENANIGKRIIWQNLFQNSLLRKNGIRCCFVPVYCRPVFNGGITYINTIHDIQAYHYPEYHPFYEVWFSKINWLVDKYKSRHIIATSQFVKKDLMEVYSFKDKIDVIHIPITLNKEDVADFEEVGKEYGIKKKEYYYAVSQLIPHKNFETLLNVFARIRKEGVDLPQKLLVSGIKGNAADSLYQKLKDNNLEDVVIFTGFVDDKVRNALYANCKAFLFPSVFEGFGMTPLEAMFFGSMVLTTKRASIPEITQNKAVYVDDPYDDKEWVEKMLSLKDEPCDIDMSRYDGISIAKQYLELFDRVFA